MKKYIFLWIILFPLSLMSQEGTPFITHYKGSRNQNMENWAICQDSRDVMYFANRHGLLSYDGYRWESIKLPKTPMSIALDTVSGKLFIGGLNTFGYLEKDSRGINSYISLSNDTSALGIVTGIHFEKNIIIFYGDESVSEYDREAKAVSRQWIAGEGKAFTGVIYTDNDLFINVAGSGLHRIDSDTLFPIVTGYLTEGCEILFALPHSGDKKLIGTSDNRLSLFDGIKYYEYPFDKTAYLEENLLAGGVEVGENYYAFSSLYGGALVVDKKTAKVAYLINYQNGLPDDEIYALASDSNEGLWLAHSYGVSRVDLRLPVQNFTGFPGLEGMLTSSIKYNNRLYVATNTGLYVLDEVKNYAEVEEYYRVKQAVNKKVPVLQESVTDDNQKSAQTTQVQSSEAQSKDEEQMEEEKKPLRKVFSRLFSKKQGEESTEEPSSAKATEGGAGSIEQPEKQAVETRMVTRKRTVSKLQSIEWIYRKIEGINTRCNRMIATDHGLIVASGSGLFSVTGLKGIKIDDSRTVNALTYSGNKLFIGSDNGIYSAEYADDKWNINRSGFKHNTPVYSMLADKNGAIWAGGLNIVYRFEELENGRYGETYWYYYNSEFQEECIIDNVNDTLMLFTDSGIQYFSDEDESFIPYIKTRDLKDGAIFMRYILNQPGCPWIFDGREWYSLNYRLADNSSLAKTISLFDNISSISLASEGKLWIIDDIKGIYEINPAEEDEADKRFKLFISKVYNEEGTVFDFDNLVFEPGEDIYLQLSAPQFIKETSTQYQILIEDRMPSWSAWSYNTEFPLFLPPGDHTIHLRAKNILGKISEEKSISISITPPFTETAWFFILMGLAALGLLWLFFDLRQRKLKHDKKILEIKVKERTIELEKKKAQIEVQRDEIIRQNEEITSSITYARRIQEAILPADDLLENNFSEYFVMFKPRDIVSGDFYWIAGNKSFLYFAVADCTGHGVPGAFMSMLGISLLNEITGEGTFDLNTGEILDTLREKIISALHQQGKDEQSSDGMDIALCKYTSKNKKLEYSGAFNPLLRYSGSKLIEYKADRQPIGFFEKAKKFTVQDVKIKKGDSLYLFSDGYYDQFGGPRDKRYSTKKLKNTLTGIAEMPMKKQVQQLEENYQLWKGDNDQVDDIIILGLRF